MSDSVFSEDSREVDPSQIHAGLRWVGGSMVVSKVLRFATTVALARLLAPELFGLVTVASGVLGVLGAAREIGFGHAYIQRQVRDIDEARRAASTTFALLLALNVLLFVLGQVLAGPVAGLLDEGAEVEPVLRAMFAAFLLDPFLTVPSLVLQKRLAFGRLSASEIASVAAYGAIAVPLALAGFGVWSLVVGELGSRIVQIGAVAWLARWRPSARFDLAIARQLFAYGKYLWGFQALSTVGGVADRLVIGRLLGAASAGAYGVAFNLCNLPATHISSLVNRIAFPAFSRIQHDERALGAAFSKALSHVSILSFPVALGLYAVAADLVHVLYGAPWVAAIPVVEILAFYGAALAVASVAGPVIQATGKPQWMLYTSLVHHVLLFSLLFALAGNGLSGVAWAVLVPLLVSSGIAFVLVTVFLRLSPTAVAGILLRSGGSAVAMLGAVRAAQRELELAGVTSHLVSLLVSIAVGGLAYLAATAILNRPLLLEFTRTMRKILGARNDAAPGAAGVVPAPGDTPAGG